MVRIQTRASIVGLLAMVFFGLFASAVSAFAASPSAATAPTGLAVKQLDVLSLRVSWIAPPTNVIEVTAYTLRLGESIVGKYPLTLGVSPTSGVLPIAKVSDGGLLTVTATIGLLSETPRSVGVTLAPGTGSVIVSPTPDPVAQNSTQAAGGSSIFGGGIQLPKPSGTVKNNPTALEAYGFSDGYTKIVDTLGYKDPSDYAAKAINGIATGLWQLSVFLQISGITFFAWALARQTYAGLSASVVAIVGAFAGSDLRIELALAGVVAYAAWSVWKLRNDFTLIYKASAYVVIFMAASLLYLSNSGAIVPIATRAPLSATQFAIVQTDSWGLKNTESTYNLSVQPTYDGDPLEQGMRRHANEEWLRSGYPGFCQVSFGNLQWSTTTYVPDSADLPTYKHLAFCEYLLKALAEDNTKALDKLRSDNGVLNIGGHVGYVEKASPGIWDFYQGHQPYLRVLYSGVALGSQLVLAPLNWGLGILLSITIVFISIDLVLLVIWLIAGSYPDFRERIMAHLKSMGRKTITPALLAAVILLSLTIQDAVFSLLGPGGWLVASVARAICTLILILYLVWKVINWVFRKVSEAMSDESLGEITSILVAQDVMPGISTATAPSAIDFGNDSPGGDNTNSIRSLAVLAAGAYSGTMPAAIAVNSALDARKANRQQAELGSSQA